VSEGRRSEFRGFGWEPAEVPDPQAPETFARSKLDWSEPGREPHRALLDWHAGLVRFRREAGLAGARLDGVRVRFDEAERWLVLEREAVTVVCNLAGRAQRIPLREGPAGAIALASDPDAKLAAGTVDLPPESVVVLRA
jgi:maltooligosyltrehalose trehalohydrolase